MSKLIIKSNYNSREYTQLKQIDIGAARHILEPKLITLLPLIHAFGGCDTTSSIFDKGKAALLKLLENLKVYPKRCQYSVS